MPSATYRPPAPMRSDPKTKLRPTPTRSCRQQTVAEATGQASRFLQVYEQYKKAPDITRQRLYIETMERILSGSDKIILGTGQTSAPGVVPVLPLNDLLRQ